MNPAPEEVVLIIQEKVYEFVDLRSVFQIQIDTAQKALDALKQKQRQNEIAIARCATFLNNECPCAVKTNWFEELDVSTDLQPEAWVQSSEDWTKL